MIEALTASGFLYGLVRRLQRQWSTLPSSEIDECVAVAVDSAFAAVSGGRPVRNLGGWLWKVAANAAQDRWDADYSERAYGAVEIDGLAAPEAEDGA
jgi:DNA-directed RNA polymerase specialized sigma24 family protein